MLTRKALLPALSEGLMHAFDTVRLYRCKTTKDTSIEMFFICYGLKPGFERYLEKMEQENLDLSTDESNDEPAVISTTEQRRGEHESQQGRVGKVAFEAPNG